MNKPKTSYFNEWLSLGLWLLNAGLVWGFIESGAVIKDGREFLDFLLGGPFLTGLAVCMNLTAKRPFGGWFAALASVGVVSWGWFFFLQIPRGSVTVPDLRTYASHLLAPPHLAQQTHAHHGHFAADLHSW